MVGGKIVGIVRREEEEAVALTGHRGPVATYRVRCNRSTDLCSVDVVERRVDNLGKLQAADSHAGRPPAIGDQVWWQGGLVFWTAAGDRTADHRDGLDFDVPLPKVGYSHTHGHAAK